MARRSVQNRDKFWSKFRPAKQTPTVLFEQPTVQRRTSGSRRSHRAPLTVTLTRAKGSTWPNAARHVRNALGQPGRSSLAFQGKFEKPGADMTLRSVSLQVDTCRRRRPALEPLRRLGQSSAQARGAATEAAAWRSEWLGQADLSSAAPSPLPGWPKQWSPAASRAKSESGTDANCCSARTQLAPYRFPAGPPPISGANLAPWTWIHA